MKINNIKQMMAALCVLGTVATGWAQQSNTVYFMRGIPERNAYNPAFQPESDGYLNWPVFPDFTLSIGNNSLNFNDIIFNKDGKTMTFLDANAGERRDDFFNALSNTTRFHSDFSFNIVGVGFRKNKNYFSFNITQKATFGAYLPKDLLSFGLYGQEKTNTFDLSKFGVQASLYTEVGVGWSRKLDEKWAVGAKLKYLIGQANIHTSFDDLSLTANQNEWTLNGSGTVHTSLPYTTIPFKDAEDGLRGQVPDWDNIEFQDGLTAANYYQAALASNWGLGVDLGLTYQVLPNLQLSAGVTDLGFIRWSKNLTNAAVNGGYSFTGADFDINQQNPDGSYRSIGDQLDDQLDSLKNGFVFSDATKAYSTALSTRLNVGAEYNILDDKIGFGLLSSTLFVNKAAYTDLTVSANFRPAKWFQPTLSYSLLNGEWSSIGFGAQIKMGMFNAFLAIDQIPLRFSKTTDNMPIPTHLKQTTLQVGWGWVFGPKSKKEKKEEVDMPTYFEPVYAPEPVEVPVYVPEPVVEPEPAAVEEAMEEVVEIIQPQIVKEVIEEKPVQSEEHIQVLEYASNEYKVDPKHYSLLNRVVSKVSASSDYNLIIEGHSDNTGNSQFNQALSEKRAGYVKDYLLKKGLNPRRISIVGRGEREPVASNTTANGRAQNRRVNVVLKLK
ncbi:hypothetical protein AGMMS49525_00670 [Bacteroidia bacterium]|nr:hypothetical protein AGMMS49525_00670 [Bacteroidia bacterium]